MLFPLKVGYIRVWTSASQQRHGKQIYSGPAATFRALTTNTFTPWNAPYDCEDNSLIQLSPNPGGTQGRHYARSSTRFLKQKPSRKEKSLYIGDDKKILKRFLRRLTKGFEVWSGSFAPSDLLFLLFQGWLAVLLFS